MLNLRHLLQAFTLSMLISGCGVTAQINKLASELTPAPSPTYEDLTDAPAITVNNPLDLSTVPTSGTGPYIYEIIEGSGSISGSTYTPGATAGDVIIKITDANGEVSHIKIPVAPTPTVSPAQAYLGVSDTFDFSGTNGVPPYTYSATGGTITSSGIFTADGSTGAATVTVTDSLGNTHTLNLTIRPSLTSSALASTIGPLNTTTVTGFEGAGGYSYSLVSGPGTVHPSTGIYSPAGQSGTAIVRVTDAAGKTSDQTITITALLTISPNNKIVVVNGTTNFAAAGGLPPYSYTVGVGNTGTVGVTTGAYQAPAVAAMESVIVTDALGNTATATVQVNPPVSALISKPFVLINTPVTVSGNYGVPPYTYSIQSGTGPGTIDSTTGVYIPSVAGIKRLKVTDSTGASAQVTTTARSPLVALNFSLVTNDNRTLSSLFGIPPQTVSIVSGGGTVSGMTFTAPSSTGTTILKVTDAEGNSVNHTVTITQAPLITAFEVLPPFLTSVVNVSGLGINYDEWCILEGINKSDSCNWQAGSLPATFDTGHLSREGRSYFAFLRRGNIVSPSVASHKFFDSVFPLGSKNNFAYLQGVAVGSDGFWVSDSELNRVYKYDLNGNWIMTLGNNPSNIDGEFKYPGVLAVDSSNNLYVADALNNRVQIFGPDGAWLRKIPADGASTVGDGYLNRPSAIFVDSSKNVYIADNSNRIQKFDPLGNWLFSFGSMGFGNGQFQIVKQIKMDSSGNIWVLDSGNSRIQKLDANGNWIMSVGGWGNSNGQFDGPAGFYLDASENIFVLDKSRLQKFSSSGAFISSTTIAASTPAEVRSATAMEIGASGNMYVIQSAANLFSKYDASRTPLFMLGPTAGADSLQNPAGVYIDRNNNIWVTEVGADRVLKFSPSGVLLLSLGGPGTGNGEFNDPMAVAVASDGSIYVADSLNLRIQKFAADGTYLSQYPIGQIIDMVISNSDILYATRDSTKDAIRFQTDGTILQVYGSGSFATPKGIALDASDNVYVADLTNQTITKFDNANTTSAVISTSGTADGQISGVQDLTVAPNGDLIVLDQNRIQVFSDAGVFKFKFAEYGYDPGENIVPLGLAVDSTGNIYVSDTFRHRIQKYNSLGQSVAH
ncbi:hypothetical protein [Bdellovibrio bacteriovorus]|uniref:hypothetical protein n=1 Tax=Bdellovibrio bacteriovorus TaxID=959 RepID=UPI0035A6DA18